MKSTGYILGFAIGIIVGLVIVAVLLKFVGCNKKGNVDERMVLARGVGFRWAFYTAFVWLLAGYIFSNFGIMPDSLFGIYCMCGAILAVVVFAVICIWKDAYIGIKENAKRMVIVFFIIGAWNVGVAAFGLITHHTRIAGTGANIICGAGLWLVGIILVAKMIMDRRGEEGEA